MSRQVFNKFQEKTQKITREEQMLIFFFATEGEAEHTCKSGKNKGSWE